MDCITDCGNLKVDEVYKLTGGSSKKIKFSIQYNLFFARIKSISENCVTVDIFFTHNWSLSFQGRGERL